MASLGELLGEYLFGMPQDAEVVEGTRGNVLPGAKYRLPDGTERWGVAAPQGLADALLGLGAAGGRVQDPNAPEGYVSQETLRRGGEGLAGSATLGSFATRAPAGALRAGMSRKAIDDITGLPLDENGMVTLYHATKTPESANAIRQSGLLKSQAEPDVYLSTAKEGTGYGDHVVAVKVDPRRLELDDEFPDGRMDFRINTGRPGGSTKIDLAAQGRNSQAAGLAMELARNQGRDELPPLLARGFERPKRDLDFIGDENRPLLREVIYDIAEDTDPFYIRPAGERPANAPLAKPAQREYETRSGNQVSRTPDDLSVSRDDVGFVEGSMAGGDPQISFSEVSPASKGTGVGSSLYRDWAKEAGVPFRSDAEVSAEAAALYDKMFPKYGYNVLRNPNATYDPTGGMSGTGGWYGPSGQHVYRVEPPGMKSTEFYVNPLAGAVPLTMPAPGPQGPTISDMGGRPIPPEEEAQRQALIRYLEGGM